MTPNKCCILMLDSLPGGSNDNCMSKCSGWHTGGLCCGRRRYKRRVSPPSHRDNRLTCAFDAFIAYVPCWQKCFGKRVWQCGIVPIYSLRPPCCPQSDSHTSHVEGGFARCVHIAAMVC
eukprot:24283-Prorocentrum_minimum.AAC.1